MHNNNDDNGNNNNLDSDPETAPPAPSPDSDSDSDWHVAFTDFRSVADAHFACTYRHRHRHPNAHELLLLLLGPSLSGSTWKILRRWHVRATTTSNAMHSRQVFTHSLCMLSASSGPGQELLQLKLLRCRCCCSLAIERYWISYFMLASSGLLCTSQARAARAATPTQDTLGV